MDIILLLIAGHFLADYPLQGEFLAKAKNHKEPIPGCPWYQALVAHSGIHGAIVGIITGSTILGLLEFVFHAAIDYGKCDERYGFNVDQFLHIGCKVIWAMLLTLGVLS